VIYCHFLVLIAVDLKNGREVMQTRVPKHKDQQKHSLARMISDLRSERDQEQHISHTTTVRVILEGENIRRCL